MNRQYLDPVFLGRYPEEMRGDLRRGLAGLRRRRPGAHPPADRFPRRQLLHAQRDAQRSRRPGRCGRAAVRQKRHAYTETGWEVYPAGPHRHAGLGHGSATATCRSTSPRTAPRSTIRRRPTDGEVAGPAARRLPPRAPARRPPRRSPRASTCAATSPGRCSTTSSGASASRSASASCTSTSQTQQRHAQGERALLLRGDPDDGGGAGVGRAPHHPGPLLPALHPPCRGEEGEKQGTFRSALPFPPLPAGVGGGLGEGARG